MQEVFSENPVYFLLASVGTSLYVLKMLLLLISGDGDSGDIDAGDVDTGDGDDLDGGESFSLVSIQSILAFFMGTGWIGLAAEREWYLSTMASLLCAAGFGFVMMYFSAYITFKIKKFNSNPRTNYKSAIGNIGRAYTNIPAKGEGIGQVEIAIEEKQRILQASSLNEAIKSFESVKVISVDDSGNVVVEKA